MRHHLRFSQQRKEAGATLVETAFVAIFMVALTGALIDIGIGLQRYGTITEGVLRTVRTLAGTPCSSILPSSSSLPARRRSTDISDSLSVVHNVRKIVADQTGDADNLVRIEVLDSGFVCDQAKFSPALASHNYPILEVKAWVKLPCLACMLLGGIEVPISTRIPVEDSGPLCGYPVMSC